MANVGPDFHFQSPTKTIIYFEKRFLPVFGFLAPMLAHIGSMLGTVDWDRIYPGPFAIAMRA